MLTLLAALLAIAPGDRVVLRDRVGTGDVRIERVERVDGERLWLKGREATVADVATLDEAITLLTRAIEREPRSARLYLDRGLIRRAKLEWKKAHADLYKALPLNASAKPLNAKWEYRIFRNLAAIYAASPDKSSRNGFHAIEWGLVATRVKEGGTAESYDTLAAAYAEAGQFEDAIQAEEEAIRMEPDGAGFKDRLKLYRDHKPFRDETGTW